MNYMSEALEEAKKAFDENEVPIGAVIVHKNKIISRAHNQCEQLKDNTAHAEMIAIRDALEKIGEKQLNECEIYVTSEPCPMCSGALYNTRVKRIYIGCMEPKTGCMGSVCNIAKLMPWSPEVYYGFSENEAKTLLRKFFEQKR